jgi:integrase
MPKTITSGLTDTKSKNTTPGPPDSKPVRLADGRGLSLLIQPYRDYVNSKNGEPKPNGGGGKWWRFNFTWEGRRQEISLGTYPDMSLAEAREKAAGARKLLDDGIRPSGTRKKEESINDSHLENNFETVAWKWLDIRKIKWGPKHRKDTIRKLEIHILPRFGQLPIDQVDKQRGVTLCEALRTDKTYGRNWGEDKEKQTGKMQTLDKILTILHQIFQFAQHLGISNVNDWTKDLRSIYVLPEPVHMPALLTPAELGAFLRKLSEYRAQDKIQTVTFLGIKFLALVFCRPGQVREAKWDKFDFVQRRWDQPSEITQGTPKGRSIVPLANQTVKLLEELKTLTGYSPYLFPHRHEPNRPRSENAFNIAIKRMGYQGKMVAHGFRSAARTILSENGFPFDWMEKQLGHGRAQNKLVASYDRGQNLESRHVMMQWWADALDKMEKGEPLPANPFFRKIIDSTDLTTT